MIKNKMSLLTEISRTVVNARTYTGPGGNIFPNTSPVTQTPAYVQRGTISPVAASGNGKFTEPSFSYDGSTMVMGNALASGAAQLLVYVPNPANFGEPYTVSSILAIPDATQTNTCTSAISYDGTVCVFGSGNDADDNGKVVVFRQVNGVWTRIFAASGGATSLFGYSVSISADGSKIVVGAFGANSVFIYTRTGSVVVLKQTLTGIAAGLSAGGSDFGNSVSFSGDGQTLAVGAPGNNTDFGAVVTYKLLNNVWSQQSTLVPVGVTNATLDPSIGGSVSLDYNGTTLAVGCYNAGVQEVASTGCVVTYMYQGGVWTQGQTIIPYDVQTSPGPDPSVVGYHVSLSANGQTLSFDGVNDFGLQGGAWIFARGANGLWRAKGNKRVGTGYTITSGEAKQYGGTMSPDASVMAVLSYEYNDTSGHAFWIFGTQFVGQAG